MHVAMTVVLFTQVSCSRCCWLFEYLPILAAMVSEVSGSFFETANLRGWKDRRFDTSLLTLSFPASSLRQHSDMEWFYLSWTEKAQNV